MTLDQPDRTRSTQRELDPHLQRYAHRTAGLTASEVRALFAVASRPEVVSLAGGMPYLPALPLDALANEIAQMVATDGMAALQYGSAQGTPELREQICEVMALEGIRAHADDVTVTVGSQMALDMVTRIFCDPGDVVLTEAPSYVGALTTFASYQAQVVQVPMDDDGLVPEALDTALRSLRAQGRAAKFLYTIPNFQNPAGVTLAIERRAAVMQLCAEHRVLIVEDNPYGLLGFAGQISPAMRATDPGNVVYLGSFSKTFAPGLRVGWALAPHAVREKLVLAAESATLCPPAFTQFVVSRYLAQHDWKSQIKAYREAYRERCEAMLDALAHHMPPGCRWTHPAGGFYVWLTVPEGLDTKMMLPRAVTQRVAYVPGTAFYSNHAESTSIAARMMRLSFCYPTPERITEGVRRLAAVLDGELELHRTFGTVHLRATSGPQSPGPDTA
jgi:2-aminoadipate transaminase